MHRQLTLIAHGKRYDKKTIRVLPSVTPSPKHARHSQCKPVQLAERGLMMFFGLVYFAQGLSCGLLAQSFTYYLKSQGMAADTVTTFFAVAALPWMIKPLYERA